MSLDFDAIFENGVLRPLRPLGLPDRARVRVSVEVEDRVPPGVSACSGSISPESAAELRRIVEAEFEKVDDREW